MSASELTKPGLIISMEGVSGCGKTFICERLKHELPLHRFICELSDRKESGIDTQILRILRAAGDPFLRTGYPETETALLIALKTFDYETRVRPYVRQGITVWEDRSVDTIAVYQAIICNPGRSDRWLKEAQNIFACASLLRPAPDLTFLIVDDFEVALKRAEQREERPFALDGRELLRCAAGLYLEYAELHRDRIMVLDRRELQNDAIIDKIHEHVTIYALRQ